MFEWNEQRGKCCVWGLIEIIKVETERESV